LVWAFQGLRAKFLAIIWSTAAVRQGQQVQRALCGGGEVQMPTRVAPTVGDAHLRQRAEPDRLLGLADAPPPPPPVSPHDHDKCAGK